jgi:uncharacterized protein YcfJ
MNLTSKLFAAALAAGALPLAQAQSPYPPAPAYGGVAAFEDYGRVTRVTPRVEQLSRPREECRTQYVQVPVQSQPRGEQRSAGGALLGAIAGGIIGNQVGGGSGRAAATAVGAIAGAVAGDRIDNGDARQVAPTTHVQEQAVRQCRMVDAVETRTVGYDVTYDYRGQTHTTFTQRDPGQRIRLRVSVEPVQ